MMDQADVLVHPREADVSAIPDKEVCRNIYFIW